MSTSSDNSQTQSDVPEGLSSNLCWLLTQASHNLNLELTAEIESMGLSTRAHMILSAAIDGEYTQIELARMVGLDKTTMVATLDELESAGLVDRKPSPTDRRVRIIALTKAGKQKLREADRVLADIKTGVLETLPAKNREVLLDSLKTLVSGRLSNPTMPSQAPRRASSR